MLQKQFDIENDKNDINNNNFFNIYSIRLKIILLIFLVLIIRHNMSKLSKIIRAHHYKIEKPKNKENEQNLEINDKILYSWNYTFWNCTFLKNEMHGYSLYNEFNFPKLSIIITIIDLIYDINEIIKGIRLLSSQNSINIEIILFFQNTNMKNYYIIENNFKKLLNDNILKIYNDTNFIIKAYTNIINMIKGRYTIFIDDLSLIPFLHLDQIFNYTKSKIDNFLNLKISEQYHIYLIKSKVLKNLNDNERKLDSYNTILYYIKSYPIPQLNFIHVSLCPNNHYTSLAYVTMSSILSSKSTNTYICFYLIVPINFEDKNINFLKSLYEEYENFNITFIKMDDRYDKAYISRNITKEAYFRFSLAELLPNLNKIIYFDNDVIVYKDLNNFYSLNFDGKIILGQPTIGNRITLTKGYNIINSGVLLLNLIKMRKYNFEKKVIEIIKKSKILNYHDQTIINDNFKEYIGIFPPEYHTRPWSNYKEMEIFNYKIGNVFDQDCLYFAHKYPTIRHYFGEYKPTNPKINHIEDWWFFARKSKYYNSNANSFDSAFTF